MVKLEEIHIGYAVFELLNSVEEISYAWFISGGARGGFCPPRDWLAPLGIH